MSVRNLKVRKKNLSVGAKNNIVLINSHLSGNKSNKLKLY